MAPKVLMVAEKPSIALSIATVLSSGRMSTRRGSTDIHEFDGKFFCVDFPAQYRDWTVTDPLDLFQAPTLKMEANPKAHIRRHLSQEARGL
ncbi:DNA topoisomerase 3-beta-1 [Ancistrocladus abbreviatus]